ncbi:MAG: TraR/DksA family transcriptional regulator [Spirochaetia bacterium]|nr:TraR/DksA family transcriptional regulator [Spirochaetia bacterium]
MDKVKLKKFKDKLQEARVEILKDLEFEQEFMADSTEQGDLVDLAEVVINNELLNRLSDIEIDTLKQIDIALEKIDKGTYGVCEGTGKNIPEARLNAIPWTPYTIEFAEQLEKQKKNA